MAPRINTETKALCTIRAARLYNYCEICLKRLGHGIGKHSSLSSPSTGSVPGERAVTQVSVIAITAVPNAQDGFCCCWQET